MTIKVLLYGRPANTLSEMGRQGFSEYLAQSGKIQLTISEEFPNSAEYLARFDVIVLAAPLPELGASRMLVDFVSRGGGLVGLGDSADNWAGDELLRSVFGATEGRRTPATELIVRVPTSLDHPITRRLYAGYAHDHYAGLDLDTAFALPEDSFWLSDRSDDTSNGRQPLLLVSWQGRRLPVAWVQRVGQGYVFQSGLGQAASSWNHLAFQQLIFRAISFVGSAGQPEGGPIRVAMLGYGAIGFEHGTAASQVPGLEFAAVCDRNPARLEEARHAFADVRIYEDASQIARDPAIDLVIVSTPPNTHASLALQMLEAGKHVVVEKPFSMTTQEANAMISLAEKVGRVLTVYQCRRWDPDYLAIRQAIESGAIGEVFHLETFIGSFSHPCDYWHSQEAISGGVFYDWGSHYLDWILGLIPGHVQSVSGFAHKRVWHDVTNEDQARVLLRFEGGQEAEFMHSDIAAALKPKWYILGTKGAIVGHWREETIKSRRWSGDLIEERLAPSEALPVLQLYQRAPGAGGGQVHEQRLALPPAPIFPFHRNLANHLLNGEPLAVTPQQARRNIAVMEAAKLSANQGGVFLPVEY